MIAPNGSARGSVHIRLDKIAPFRTCRLNKVYDLCRRSTGSHPKCSQAGGPSPLKSEGDRLCFGRTHTVCVSACKRLSDASATLRCLPYPIEDPRRQCCLVLPQKAPAVLLYDVRRVLDGILACSQDTVCVWMWVGEDISDVVRAMR